MSVHSAHAGAYRWDYAPQVWGVTGNGPRIVTLAWVCYECDKYQHPVTRGWRRWRR